MYLNSQAGVAFLSLILTLASISSAPPQASAPVIDERPSAEIEALHRPAPVAQKFTVEAKDAVASKETVLEEDLQSIKSKASSDDKLPLSIARPSIYANGTGKKIATVAFWDKLAYCETHSDWENPGRYAGGLGIYIGTWRQWGGTQFAECPSRATRSEQIVVANRISTQGWVREDGRFQRPVWFTGWGALKCAGRPELVSLEDQRAYTLEQSRTAP